MVAPAKAVSVGIDEAHQIAVDAAGDAEKGRGDDPGRDLGRVGPDAHGLGLVLVVPDGVEREPEPGRQQPGEGERAGDRQHKREIIEQQADIAEVGRRIGRQHAGPGADPGNAGGDLAGGDAESERADGEIMPAHRQHERAEQPGHQTRWPAPPPAGPPRARSGIGLRRTRTACRRPWPRCRARHRRTARPGRWPRHTCRARRTAHCRRNCSPSGRRPDPRRARTR